MCVSAFPSLYIDNVRCIWGISRIDVNGYAQFAFDILVVIFRSDGVIKSKRVLVAYIETPRCIEFLPGLVVIASECAIFV